MRLPIVKESQKKETKVCKAKVESLTKVNRDNLSVGDLIKLKEKLKEAMGMKQKMEEEVNREVENRVGDKKQVVTKKMRKTVRIVITQMNPINGRGKT